MSEVSKKWSIDNNNYKLTKYYYAIWRCKKRRKIFCNYGNEWKINTAAKTHLQQAAGEGRECKGLYIIEIPTDTHEHAAKTYATQEGEWYFRPIFEVIENDQKVIFNKETEDCRSPEYIGFHESSMYNLTKENLPEEIAIIITMGTSHFCLKNA